MLGLDVLWKGCSDYHERSAATVIAYLGSSHIRVDVYIVVTNLGYKADVVEIRSCLTTLLSLTTEIFLNNVHRNISYKGSRSFVVLQYLFVTIPNMVLII